MKLTCKLFTCNHVNLLGEPLHRGLLPQLLNEEVSIAGVLKSSGRTADVDSVVYLQVVQVLGEFTTIGELGVDILKVYLK